MIDDGIATGATMRAALQATRTRKPRKLILAVPVAPTATIEELRGEVDEIVCLEAHEFFGAIGFYYSDQHLTAGLAAESDRRVRVNGIGTTAFRRGASLRRFADSANRPS